ncbi:MAG: restriction endonuclease [Desulfurococcales archaeon]|nr:restriction endonuclease [Desulfurococcales archaeon]
MEGPGKGRLFEDLVEYYFQLRGYHGRRNVRVRGASGAVHEVDLLLETREGPVVVEVKNLSQPVPKEVVMKAFEVARDIGARGAVVVSASGFTRGALAVARSLGVEAITMEDLLEYVEAARALRGSTLLEARHGLDALDREARRRARGILFLRREEPVRLGCIYAPIYHVEATIRLGGILRRYRDVDLAFSAVTGLPLYKTRGALAEGGSGALAVPEDLAWFYREKAGRVVRRSEAIARLGASGWRRLEAVLRAHGLLEDAGARPRAYRILDDRPPLRAVEEAASLLLAPKSGGPGGCVVLEPRYSPGSASAAASRLYGATGRAVRLFHAPLAVYKLVGRGGVYRILLLTMWTPKPLPLETPEPEAYAAPLL